MAQPPLSQAQSQPMQKQLSNNSLQMSPGPFTPSTPIVSPAQSQMNLSQPQNQTQPQAPSQSQTQPQSLPQSQPQSQPHPQAQTPLQPHRPPQNQQPSFGPPPPKRQRVSPPDPRQSQPSSPFVQNQSLYSANHNSPAAFSPRSNNTPLPGNNALNSTNGQHFNSTSQLVTASSPAYTSHLSTPGTTYNTPYSSGGNTTPIQQGAPNTALYGMQYQNNNSTPATPQAQYSPRPSTQNTLPSHPPSQLSNQLDMATTQHGPGSMGPPSKPVERENVSEDQTDVLANAGVDLKAEEAFATSFYSGSFKAQPEFSAGLPATGHAYTQFPPGDASAFYGAGPMSQPGVSVESDKSQNSFTAEHARQAWESAVLQLARSREHELSNPHMQVTIMWRRMDKIARQEGIMLNTDPGGKMPPFQKHEKFPADVRAQALTAQRCALTTTNGPFLPPDAALADQLALMSLATNQRLRILLEEAHAVAISRRTGSDGVVPAEWAEVAVPSSTSNNTIVNDEVVRSGWESAISPLTMPRKRSISMANHGGAEASDPSKPSGENVRFTSQVVKALREIAVKEREEEEERLRKRRERASGVRTGSGVPGTPVNGIAPDMKPMTKKERDKQEKNKAGQVDNHATANNTMNIMFGSKKKSKYSWAQGAGGSGASTPARLNTTGLAGLAAMSAPEKVRHTVEGGRPIGGLREYDQKKIEMKDWLLTLESDGREPRALQRAYANPANDRK